MAAAVAAAAPRSPPVPLHETAASVLSLEEQYAAADRRHAAFMRLMAENLVPGELCNAVRFCLPPPRWPGKNLQQRARAAWAEVEARGVGRHPTIARMSEKEVCALLGGALCEDCSRPRPFAPDWVTIADRARALGKEDATRAAAVVEICRTLQALLAMDGGDGRGDSSDDVSGGGHATAATVTAAAAAAAAVSPSSPSSPSSVPSSAGDGDTRRRRNRRHRRHPAA